MPKLSTLLQKLSSKTSSPPTTTPTMPSTKRGLAWPNEGTQTDIHKFTRPGTQISWLYNWGPHPTPSARSLHFVPMQWNGADMGSVAPNVERYGADTLLGFNEPELGDQANMSVEQAAKEWLEFVEPLRKRGVRCGSPGISSDPRGVAWLKGFVEEVRKGGSDVDFWALHWYGEGVGGFYDYLWSTHHQLGPSKPVWITEWACTNWSLDNPLPQHQVEAFAKETCGYLDTLDWVERYAWFGAMRDAGTVGPGARLLDDKGELTALGKWYREG